MKDITIKSNKDLEGRIWTNPDSNKGIVVAHSFRNSFEEPVCLEASQGFHKQGYNVLTINLVGHGKSAGGLRDVSLRAVSENVSSAIKYLKEIGVDNIGAYAISLGTSATILSKERPMAQVFLSPSPLFNPRLLLDRYSNVINPQREGLEERGYAIVQSGSGRGNFEIGQEWINEMESGKMQTQETHMKNKTPTLIIQGTKDDLTDVAQVRKLINRFGDSSLIIYGADHNFSRQSHRDTVIKKASEWFGKYLN